MTQRFKCTRSSRKIRLFPPLSSCCGAMPPAWAKKFPGHARGARRRPFSASRIPGATGRDFLAAPDLGGDGSPRPGMPYDLARPRQPRLAASLRARDRGHAERFRVEWSGSFPSRPPRLPRLPASSPTVVASNRSTGKSSSPRPIAEAARPTRAGLRVDPENALVWRMNLRRMEAEVLRDSLARDRSGSILGSEEPGMQTAHPPRPAPGEPTQQVVPRSRPMVPSSGGAASIFT